MWMQTGNTERMLIFRKDKTSKLEGFKHSSFGKIFHPGLSVKRLKSAKDECGGICLVTSVREEYMLRAAAAMAEETNQNTNDSC